MSKEFDSMGIYPCHKEEGAKLIGTGIDSNVHKVGDLVVKNYKLQTVDGVPSGLNLNILNNYFQITNLAQIYLENHPMALRSAGLRRNYSVAINPFLEMHKCDRCGGIEGVCKFVPGPKLESSCHRLGLDNLLDELRDISHKLENGLSVMGIQVIPVNMKVTGENLVIITDLCADVSLLHRILN